MQTDRFDDPVSDRSRFKEVRFKEPESQDARCMDADCITTSAMAACVVGSIAASGCKCHGQYGGDVHREHGGSVRYCDGFAGSARTKGGNKNGGTRVSDRGNLNNASESQTTAETKAAHKINGIS